MKMLHKEFFNRKTKVVAKGLLGKVIVRKVGHKKISLLITEVEAYIGPHDLACHSSKGKTPRTEVMYMEGGTIYVYLIYGMYYMLNIVTEKEDFPAAILIRGVEGISGPGRVSKHLLIDKKLNGFPLSKKTGLWIEDSGIILKPKDIVATPRIGINYAGEIWANKKLRFLVRDIKRFL